MDLTISAEKYLHIKLEDDNTPNGGKSFADETLKDFLYSIDKPFNSPMYKVNYWLKQCGLKTIKF